MDLVGNDELHEEVLCSMWKESVKSVNCKQARITFDYFLLLMKAQTKEREPYHRLTPSSWHLGLVAVPEEDDVAEIAELLSVLKASRRFEEQLLVELATH